MIQTVAATLTQQADVVPVVFGPPERSLFGFFHAAKGALQRTIGVVLCNPLGYEAMCAHRTYLRLAEQFAANGLPALRFDYPGTGDSSGYPEEPGRVQTWLHGIDLAIDELRERSGVRSIALFGVRFGATLAATCAAKRTDVDSLILWGPAAAGRTYVREFRAFRMIKEPETRPRRIGAGEGDEEVAGYLFDRETVTDLCNIDLLDVEGRLARHALIIPRDDLPGSESRIARHFQARGVDVSLRTEPGYGRMMRDPQDTIVPLPTLQVMVDWLKETSSVEPRFTGHPRPQVLGAISRTSSAPVREEPFLFGEGGRLFGILTEPSNGPVLPGRPAVVFLNVGANHHVGPNRMYVTLARDLAALGYCSFRFDVAGLGDSRVAPAARENRLYSKDSVGDVATAMTFLRELRDVGRFVLVGLCSGAYLAFHTGIEDSRVAGEILINPQTFEWKEGDSLDLSVRKSFLSTRYYLRSVFERSVWARGLRGELNLRGVAGVLRERLATRAGMVVKSLAARLQGHQEPQTEIERAFLAMSDRGIQTLMVFNSSDGGIDMIEKHLGHGARKMRARKNFQMQILEGADHTFTPIDSQHELQALLTHFITEHFP